VVGDPSANIEEARDAAKKRVSRRAQKKMQGLLDQAENLVQ
ncbi:azurin, partial [Vibrio breoganii]